MSKLLHISPEIRDILAKCEITDTTLKIPSSIGQLPRQQYTALNKVLEAAGGKWTRALGLHTFTRDPREVLGLSIETGLIKPPEKIIDIKKHLNQFFTPQAIAWEVAQLLGDIDGARVLEPEAGEGALANAAREYGGKVDCIEIDGECVKSLKGQGHNVFQCDFLEFKPVDPVYDAILMNPPFSGGRDIAHVQHAFEYCLKRGGVLVAIISPGFQFRNDRKYQDFRDFFAEVGGEVVKELPSGTFRESGTDVRTVIIRIEK